ncbi:uncharacterized protein [Porites lutea]|uniref:uncharacterized protein isoform X2 n=1 Tax=Porites lutea TaxID=51062 RepID=UPI003CC66A1A
MASFPERSRKVQVTILASEWGSSKGGLSSINRELAIQFAKCPEAEITFFLPKCSQEDKKLALQHNVKIVEATRRPGLEELEWLLFPPENLQIDVIVGHGVKLGKQAQIIKERKNCKWIQVVHTDPEELGMFKNYSNPISKGEEKHKTEVELCEMADHVVGIGSKLSEAFRSYLRGCKKRKSVVDLTPGVFEEFVSVIQDVEERKQPSVLVFGRGDAEDFELKGFDIAGKAVAALQDTRLVFVGAPDGKHEEIANRLTECGVPKSRLRVKGFMGDRESLRRLFQQVDLVVMPSRTEGFGLAGLEALSAGLPVLVSRNSGFGESLCSVPFGSSFVVNSEDPTDWTAAISKIWAKDRKSRLEEVEILRDSYDKKYNWAEQIKDLLHKMISWTNVDFSNVQSFPETIGGTVVSSQLASQATQGTTEKHADLDSTQYTSTKERSNYSRLCRLLISLGSKALRETFDKIIPPQSLHRILKRNPAHSKLQSRRKEEILNSVQWSKLYPTTRSEVSSAGFDIPLLMVLLRTICDLSPPPAGWDAPPLPEDLSRESDIARLKYFFNAVSSHAGEGFVSDAVFSSYWLQIHDTLVRFGGADYEDVIEQMRCEEMDVLSEEHFRELLKQWRKVEDNIKDKLNELESAEALKMADFSFPTEIVEKIRQLYGTREQRLLPVPWCEDFSFHLNEIFTRLKIVSKEKTRGVLTDDITDMTAIFKPHVECQRPRTVLIEGDPGMGKSTYCQKLAYDWATKQKELDPSFPDIDVLLLLKCHELKSSILKAIDDQLLPAEIDDQTKECFFNFVRENQSKVLLVLDGLDEMDSTEMKRIYDLVEGKELSGCYVILTSRHEVGRKLRRYCDTLWEIVGFTEEDASSFIRRYFKSIKREDLLENLLEKIRYSHELRNLSKNPLNVTLLCVLCEDLEGVFPTSRTELYTEIVNCVLRRYEKKKGLSSNNEDLMSVYTEDLMHLGQNALQSLRKGELYFEEHESGGTFIALPKFGFLSLQASGSKRKARVRYAFLHKSFQEFFSGFYLACQILDGGIDCVSVVKDESFKDELKQVFLFMIGILASTSKETAESVIKIMAENINLIEFSCGKDFCELFHLALDCILECTSLSRTLGLHLHISDLDLSRIYIEDSGAASLSQVLAANSSVTSLDLGANRIRDSGADSLSQALAANSSLTSLVLRGNYIADAGAASLSQALADNSSLTTLDLSINNICDAGADSLSQALIANSCLISLDLRRNLIDDSGADSLSQALAANSSLTDLDLSDNNIGDSGATSLSQALATNSSLTSLDLKANCIGDSGGASLFQALVANSTLTYLNLSKNDIRHSSVASLCQALATNSSLTGLDLSRNFWIGDDDDALSLSQALAANSSLMYLRLSGNMISDSGATLLSQALAANSSLTISYSESEEEEELSLGSPLSPFPLSE